MKKILPFLLVFCASSVFAKTITFTCPSINTIAIRDYDGAQWELVGNLKAETGGQTTVVRISAYMPKSAKPILTDFDKASVGQWSGGPQLIACHYFGAPALHTAYHFTPGDCKATGVTRVVCKY